MTILQYLTSRETGCCSTFELIALSKEDKPAVTQLKEWAKVEMESKGIPITEK